MGAEGWEAFRGDWRMGCYCLVSQVRRQSKKVNTHRDTNGRPCTGADHNGSVLDLERYTVE